MKRDKLRLRHQSVIRNLDGSYFVRDWKRKNDRDEPLSFEYPNVVDLLYHITAHFDSSRDPIEVIVPHVSSARRRKEPTYPRTPAESAEAERVLKETDLIISIARAYHSIAQEMEDAAKHLEIARPSFSRE